MQNDQLCVVVCCDLTFRPMVPINLLCEFCCFVSLRSGISVFTDGINLRQIYSADLKGFGCLSFEYMGIPEADTETTQC